MKKIAKTILCLAIAASLCIAGTSMVWAAEGDSSDISLEDLLGLLNQLTGDSEDAEGTGEAEIDEIEVEDVSSNYTTVSVGSYSFDVPNEWYENAEESGDTLTYYAPSSDKWITVTYAEGIDDSEQLDLSDPDQEALITQAISAGSELGESSHITVCGVDSLALELSMELGNTTIASYTLIVPYGNELFMLGVSGITDCEADFAALVDSIVIEGAEGGTSTAKTDSKPAAAEGIDATAVDQVVLIDDDVCTVTIKSFDDSDSYYGLVAKIFVENKTDINLYFSINDASINGLMVDPYWGTSVSAGHKANQDLHFYKDDLEENNITQFHDIEFNLTVRDDDDYSAPYLEDQDFIIYPFGMDVPEQEPQEFDDDAIIMVQEDDFSMIIKSFSEDEYYIRAHVYLENNTDKKLEFKVSGDSTVNGYEISPYFYRDIMPDKKMNTEMTWSIRDLDANDIVVIEDMELELEISDADDWSADPLYSDVIYITFE